MKKLEWKQTLLGVNYLVVKFEDAPFCVDYETGDELVYLQRQWLKKSEEDRMDLAECMNEPANAIVYDFSTQNLDALFDVTPSELLEGALEGITQEPHKIVNIPSEEGNWRDSRVLAEAQKNHAFHVEYHRERSYWKGNPKDLFVVIVDMTEWIEKTVKEELAAEAAEGNN